MISKCCALDLAKYRIRVNAVSPGDIFTPAYEKELQLMVEKDGWDYQEAWELVNKEMSAFERLGAPAEAAAVINFLASDEASFITGENIVVDAGRKLLR